MISNSNILFAKFNKDSISHSIISDKLTKILEDNLVDVKQLHKSLIEYDNNNFSLDFQWGSSTYTFDIFKKNNEIFFIGKEEKSNKELLEQKQQGDLAVLGEMVAGLMHDINNPLSNIIASISLIDGNAEDLLEENLEDERLLEIKNFAKEVQSNAARIYDMIAGVKSFAHGEEVEFEVELIEDIVKQSLSFCEGFLKKDDIKLTFNNLLPKGTWKCYIKASDITRVIVNMITNAKDAISELKSHRKWIEVSLLEKNENFYIEIKDGGNGIPLEIQDRIFDSFYTTKGYGKGTGLGLSQAKKTIENHNGKLIINKKSKNTSFVFSLPKKEYFDNL